MWAAVHPVVCPRPELGSRGQIRIQFPAGNVVRSQERTAGTAALEDELQGRFAKWGSELAPGCPQLRSKGKALSRGGEVPPEPFTQQG